MGNLGLHTVKEGIKPVFPMSYMNILIADLMYKSGWQYHCLVRLYF